MPTVQVNRVFHGTLCSAESSYRLSFTVTILYGCVVSHWFKRRLAHSTFFLSFL